MNRRTYLIGLGALTTTAAAATGTGAFSSTRAERSVAIETADDDASAALGLTPNPEYDGEERVYAEVVDGTLELSFEDVNRDATVTFEDLVTVTNDGTRPVYVYVNNDFGTPNEDPIWGSSYGSDGPLDVTIDEERSGSIVGGNLQQTDADVTKGPRIGPGDSWDLTFVIDTRGRGEVDLDGTILIVAE